MNTYLNYLGLRNRHGIATGLSAGLIIGMLTIASSVSSAALIFSGELLDATAYGIGVGLFTAAVVGGMTALFSSNKMAIAQPQSAVAAILALISVGVLTTLPENASAELRFVTVAASIGIVTITTGILLGLMGIFRLGDFIRYIPYPVVGGFVAGVNWLLVVGAIRVMVGVPLQLEQLPYLLQPSVMIYWLPGLLLGLLIFYVYRHSQNPLALPALLIGATGVFYAFMLLKGQTGGELLAQGWLLGPFPESSEWSGFSWQYLARVDWIPILLHVSVIVTVFIVSAVYLLLNASALELTSGEDTDVNHELRLIGISNALSGFGGGFIGFHSSSLSGLGMRMGSRTRLAGLVAALCVILVLAFGTAALAYVPRLILGGVLFSMGLTTLTRWIYDAYFELPRSDYLIILGIVTVVALVGLLEGVIVGVLIAVVVFVVSYSRINVVKHEFSGITYHSNVDRAPARQKILNEHGDLLFILELQGYIFFGTAYRLLDQVKTRVGDPDLSKPLFVLLDFRRVNRTDSSAAISFSRMKQLASTDDFTLVFTNISPQLRNSVEKGGYYLAEDDCFNTFSDLDHGIEWCENKILARFDPDGAGMDLPLAQMMREALPEKVEVGRMVAYLEKLEVEAGYVLMHQGDPPEDMFYLESGLVTVILHTEEGGEIRLRTMGPGTVVGEVALYTRHYRSASVVADRLCVLYRLSLDVLKEMEITDPEVAVAFHQYNARLLAERVVNTNRALQASLD